MRETSVSDEDLAIQVAKQKLATIRDRPGYAQATRVGPLSRLGRFGLLGGAAASAYIAYACWHHVTAAWLMWLLIVIFGGFALLLLFALLGFSQKIDHWGAAVVERRIADDKHVIVFLSEKGERREISVGEPLYDAVRPGDIGIVSSSGSGEWTNIDAFERI